MLNGYRHEYENLDEVVKELNLMLQNAYKSDEIISYYKSIINCYEETSGNKKAKAEAITEFAERLTIHFGTYTDKDYVRVLDVVRFVDQIAKEMKGEQ